MTENTLETIVRELSRHRRIAGNGYSLEALEAKQAARTKLAQMVDDELNADRMVDTILTHQSPLVRDTLSEVVVSKDYPRVIALFEVKKGLATMQSSVTSEHSGVNVEAAKDFQVIMRKHVNDPYFARYFLNLLRDRNDGARYISEILRTATCPEIASDIQALLTTNTTFRDRLNYVVDAINPDWNGMIDLLEYILKQEHYTHNRNLECAAIEALGRSNSKRAQEIVREVTERSDVIRDWHLQHSVAISFEAHLNDESEEELRQLAGGFLFDTAWQIAGRSYTWRIPRFFKACSLYFNQAPLLRVIRMRSAVALRNRDPLFASVIFSEAVKQEKTSYPISYSLANSAERYLEQMEASAT